MGQGGMEIALAGHLVDSSLEDRVIPTQTRVKQSTHPGASSRINGGEGGGSNPINILHAFG